MNGSFIYFSRSLWTRGFVLAKFAQVNLVVGEEQEQPRFIEAHNAGCCFGCPAQVQVVWGTVRCGLLTWLDRLIWRHWPGLARPGLSAFKLTVQGAQEEQQQQPPTCQDPIIISGTGGSRRAFEPWPRLTATAMAAPPHWQRQQPTSTKMRRFKVNHWPHTWPARGDVAAELCAPARSDLI